LQLEARPVQWLWPDRIPQGGLTVLAGEPGLGKSLLSLWLASRLARDPDDPEGETGARRVLAHAKSNLGQLASSLAYHIEAKAIGSELQAPTLVAGGGSRFSAAELLALNEPEERSKLGEAEALLRAELEMGLVQ
jgi:AAA domain